MADSPWRPTGDRKPKGHATNKPAPSGKTTGSKNPPARHKRPPGNKAQKPPPRKPAARGGKPGAATPPRPATPPRQLAAEIVARMWEGLSLSELLHTELPRAKPEDRPLAAELAQGVARWGQRLQAISLGLLNHPIEERHREVRALLLVGLYQMIHSRVPAHAAVSETVNAAGGLRKPWARGLINGVLRNYQRDGEALAQRLDSEPAVRHSHPDWLVARLQRAWPDDWEGILQAANQRPPMHLRVNRSRIERKAYALRLSEAGIPCRPLAHCPDGLQLDTPVDVHQLPGFAEGLVSVQDGGAQLAALLLDPQPGEAVLDACAAPGGKSCHILEVQPDTRLTAMDQVEARLGRLRENLQRLGQTAEVACGDAARPAGAWSERRYQRILLDVPCSASGVIRRHPDIKWLRRDEDIAALAEEQRRILDTIWPLLEPGGVLLYVTCSILPEENSGQIDDFLQRHPDASAEPIAAAWGRSAGAGRQLLPGDHGFDGFFYALLHKAPDSGAE